MTTIWSQLLRLVMEVRKPTSDSGPAREFIPVWAPRLPMIELVGGDGVAEGRVDALVERRAGLLAQPLPGACHQVRGDDGVLPVPAPQHAYARANIRRIN